MPDWVNYQPHLYSLLFMQIQKDGKLLGSYPLPFPAPSFATSNIVLVRERPKPFRFHPFLLTGMLQEWRLLGINSEQIRRL